MVCRIKRTLTFFACDPCLKRNSKNPGGAGNVNLSLCNSCVKTNIDANMIYSGLQVEHKTPFSFELPEVEVNIQQDFPKLYSTKPKSLSFTYCSNCSGNAYSKPPSISKNDLTGMTDISLNFCSKCIMSNIAVSKVLKLP